VNTPPPSADPNTGLALLMAVLTKLLMTEFAVAPMLLCEVPGMTTGIWQYHRNDCSGSGRAEAPPNGFGGVIPPEYEGSPYVPGDWKTVLAPFAELPNPDKTEVAIFVGLEKMLEKAPVAPEIPDM
jgi:hypothetical protein